MAVAWKAGGFFTAYARLHPLPPRAWIMLERQQSRRICPGPSKDLMQLLLLPYITCMSKGVHPVQPSAVAVVEETELVAPPSPFGMEGGEYGSTVGGVLLSANSV